MDNQVRRKLERAEVVLGMMHFTGSPMIVEVMASAGMDFFIIDMEHSPIDLGLAAQLIRAGDAAGITPFARVPEVDPGLIKKLLNAGADGIVVPHANRESCAAAVQAVRYEPEGLRGSCPAVRSAGYTQPDWAAYQARENREVLVIPLIEDPQALEDFEALAAMDGVDVFFLGPFDFSVAAGVPGAGFEHPVMAAAARRMVDIAERHGKHVMTSVGDRIDTDYCAHIIDIGMRMISYSADALVFQRACKDIVALKGHETTAAVTARAGSGD